VNQRVSTLDEARQFVSHIGYPVVVKPNAADFGQGVTAEIRGDEQLALAFARARPFGDVLVEQHIVGENYRLLVIDGICRGVNHRVQPDVVGDVPAS
jgi:cyanophycin synthetase